MSGTKPKTSTPADKRLKANKTSTAKTASGAAPKFGSPAWKAKYGK